MNLNPLLTDLLWGLYTCVHRDKALEDVHSSAPVKLQFSLGSEMVGGRKGFLSLSILNSEYLKILQRSCIISIVKAIKDTNVFTVV